MSDSDLHPPVPAPPPARARQTPPGGARGWFIWALGASTFGYAFFQRVAPSVMVEELMRDFAVGGAVLGNLSALYFYTYAGMQIPVGVMIDRWGARNMITLALLIAGLGSLIFSFAQSIHVAYLGRLLIGLGSGVGFVGTLTLVSRWFPVRRFAFFAGLTMLVGMASGVGGQAPLSEAVALIGWRQTLLFAGLAAGVLAAVIFLFVRNTPDEAAHAHERKRQRWAQVWINLRGVLKNLDVWRSGLVAMTMSAPLLSFASLWGVPYMMVRYGLDRPEAAGSTSLMLIGWGIGAPLGGWVSDHLGRRKLPLLCAALANFVLLCVLFYVPGLPLAAAAVAIFLLGVVGGSMVITFALGREYTPENSEGAVSGFVNGTTVGAGAVFQPLIGFLLDMNWNGVMANGARIYSLETYTTAMSCLVAAAGLGAAGAFFIRETRCERIAGNEAARPAV